MRFFVTGGAGYVGSHFVREALRQGHECFVYDDLQRGHREFVPNGVELTVGDVREQTKLCATLQRCQPDAIFHFAALALVPESVREPQLYEDNNVGGMRSLLAAMVAASCRVPVIFSSTCAVFGTPIKSPIAEDDPKQPENPYGATKLKCEQLLEQFVQVEHIPAMALRYFNACGADLDGKIGEWHEPETHLIPNILRAALAGETVQIFGDDFPTPDGTCVRDYVHVTDLACAHILAAERLLTLQRSSAAASFEVMHLGTGVGHSNLQVLHAAEDVLGQSIAYTIAPRRLGDPAELVANPSRAQTVLGLKFIHSDMRQIIASALAWQRRLSKF